MVKVSEFRFKSETAQIINNLGDVLRLAEAFNLNNDAKLSIFKSFEGLEFKYSESKREIEASIRNIPLPEEAIQVLMQEQYCIVDANVFFVNEFDKALLYDLYGSNSQSRKIKAASLLNARGIISENELRLITQQLADKLPIDSSIKFTANLYPYQKEGFSWLKERYQFRKGAILADDMGLGKTAQVIALIADALATNSAKFILIVVPNSLIANWQIEFGKFTEGIVPYVHWGGARLGFASELSKHNVVITTYSTISNDLSLFKQLFFDLLICDEASLLKNPDSKRSMSISELSVGSIVEITGTPFENSMLDLWSLSNLLVPNFLGERGLFESEYVAPGVESLTDEQIESVENKIRPILLRRMKEDVLTQLPPKLDIFTALSMTSRELNLYNTLESQIRESASQKSVALALISKLRKFTAHPLLDEDKIYNASLSELEAHSSKFSHLKTLIKQIKHKNEKALVFANHVRLLDVFNRIFELEMDIPSFKIDGSIEPTRRQDVVEDFTNIDGAALLFLNPITAGMGLNITSANHVIHYSRQWNPALEEQATARAYRNGQKTNVFVHFLYYAETVEQIIHERIMKKSYVSGNVIRATNIVDTEEEMIFDMIVNHSRAI